MFTFRYKVSYSLPIQFLIFISDQTNDTGVDCAHCARMKQKRNMPIFLTEIDFAADSTDALFLFHPVNRLLVDIIWRAVCPIIQRNTVVVVVVNL